MIRSTPYVLAGLVLGAFFWVLVQRLTPAIANWFVDIVVIPAILASAIAAALTLPRNGRLKVFAVAFLIGTIAFSVLYLLVMTIGSDPPWY